MTPAGHPNRRLRLVLAAAALCYLIGYPLALVGHSAIGWAFVALGGPFLLALLAMVIRRVHLSSSPPSGTTTRTVRGAPAAEPDEQRY